MPSRTLSPLAQVAWLALLARCAAATTPRYDAAVEREPVDVAVAEAAVDVAVDAPPCHWAAGPAQLLTERTQDWSMQGVAVGASGLLASVQVSDADPPHDRAWRVVSLGFDAVPAASGRVTVLSQPDYLTGYASMSLVAQPRAAAVAWDEHRGMLLVPLDAAGMPAASPRAIQGTELSSVDVAGEGFVVLSSDATQTALQSQVLDASGAPTGETHTLAPFAFAGTYPEWRRATLDDGTFLLATLTGDASARTLGVGHFTAQGVSLGEMHSVTGFVATARLRLLSHGSQAWAGQVASDPRGVGVVLLQQLDARGAAVGMPVALPSARPVSPYYWSLVWRNDQLVVVWFGGGLGAASTLMMQTVSTDLTVLGDPVLLDTAGASFGNALALRDTPQGPVLVYEAEATRGEPMQVYARTLRCQ